MAKKRDTAGFLRMMNARNEEIAQRSSAEEQAKHVGEDPVRVQREAERRERLGQLRAREHTSKRRKGQVIRNVFGFTDLSD